MHCPKSRVSSTPSSTVSSSLISFRERCRVLCRRVASTWYLLRSMIDARVGQTLEQRIGNPRRYLSDCATLIAAAASHAIRPTDANKISFQTISGLSFSHRPQPVDKSSAYRGIQSQPKADRVAHMTSLVHGRLAFDAHEDSNLEEM